MRTKVILKPGERIINMDKSADKEAFVYLMELLSDYTKCRMIDMFLEHESLKAGDFLSCQYHFSSRDVYGNLNKWIQDGIVFKRRKDRNHSFEYSLVGHELMHRLCGRSMCV